ncbi:uncharacterized protein BP5553_05036 [Venustampulla echinocandica]|uniref:Uncharacterized protein n=1 Tax=Venustampulla echinocandica TaxID=2656787 RepID=A0A370TQ10_9HELO|nr:uncharacterized protein BP5553_05036 [Venustampulla echinocandica]RDL37603.1 hypothetical protein BP5553_05036 [Venustampulla echinocandica]
MSVQPSNSGMGGGNDPPEKPPKKPSKSPPKKAYVKRAGFPSVAPRYCPCLPTCSNQRGINPQPETLGALFNRYNKNRRDWEGRKNLRLSTYGVPPGLNRRRRYLPPMTWIEYDEHNRRQFNLDRNNPRNITHEELELAVANSPGSIFDAGSQPAASHTTATNAGPSSTTLAQFDTPAQVATTAQMATAAQIATASQNASSATLTYEYPDPTHNAYDGLPYGAPGHPNGLGDAPSSGLNDGVDPEAAAVAEEQDLGNPFKVDPDLERQGNH